MTRRYCGMCDKLVPARERECRACGADTDPWPDDQPNYDHTCHDMQPPFPGPCAACDRERAEVLASPVYPTAAHSDSPKPVDLMDALRRALPKEK